MQLNGVYYATRVTNVVCEGSKEAGKGKRELVDNSLVGEENGDDTRAQPDLKPIRNNGRGWGHGTIVDQKNHCKPREKGSSLK